MRDDINHDSADHGNDRVDDKTRNSSGNRSGDSAGGGDPDSRDWVDRLEEMPPGLESVRALSALRLDSLSAYELVAVAQAWERQKAWDAACQLEVMARLVRDPVYQRCDRPEGVEVGHVHRAVDLCGDELSLALAWSPGRAKAVLATAVELEEDLPATLAALKSGDVDADKARLIVERTRCLTVAGQRRRVEADALMVAPRLTRTQLDYALRRAVIAADPEGAAARRAHAVEARRVSPPQAAAPGADDGMAVVSLSGPAEDVTAFYTAVDAAARHARTAGDPRTLEQLRFDTATGLGWTALSLGHLGCCNPTCNPTASTSAAAPHSGLTDVQTYSGGAVCGSSSNSGPGLGDFRSISGLRTGSGRVDVLPGSASSTSTSIGLGVSGHKALPLGRRHGRAAAVGVTVAASTLFGADELPGWLDGFGPITAPAARHIAVHGTWRRLLTDPVTGELLEYGRTTYFPPARLVDHVIARDRTCRFPTCTHPARHTDIDHKHPYAQGGTTGATNCWALHRAHHVAKTLHGHRLHTDTNGTTWWTTPTGHTYPTQPTPIGSTTSRNATTSEKPKESHALEPPPF